MTPEIRMIAVDALIPYARNARTHSDGQVAQIAASIAEFGFTNPILSDGERGVIAGHGRFEVESDVVVITQDPTGASVRMSVDPAALLDAIDRSSAREGDDEDDGLFVHDMDEPASGELLEMVLNGTGLVPITAEIAQSLVDSGYTSEQVAEATAAGAQYSPSRHSIFYPPESSF